MLDERKAPVPVQMELKRIIISEIHDQQVIMLKEVEGERSFPIVIGIFEATSIDRRVKGFEAPRPLTHDLLVGAVEALGGEGLMLRQPKSLYAVGRSNTLLKVKTFHDAEATVIGHAPGTGKHKGRLGALIAHNARVVSRSRKRSRKSMHARKKRKRFSSQPASLKLD